MTDQREELFAKIKQLPPETIAAVDDFVEYLISKDKMGHLTKMLVPFSRKYYDNQESMSEV